MKPKFNSFVSSRTPVHAPALRYTADGGDFASTSTRRITVLAAGFAALFITGTAHAADKNWVGGNGNFNSETATEGWNGPKPVNDIAYVNTGATVTIDSDQTNQDFKAGSIAGQSGIYTQTAGTVNLSGWMRFGLATGGSGTYNLSGGTLAMPGSGRINIGGSNNGSGTFNLSDTGNLTTPGGTVRIGGGDEGDGDVGTGILNVTGGTANLNGELWLGQATGSVGTMNMSAGTFTIHNWVALGRAGAAGTLNFSGGTLNHDAAANGAGRFSIASGGGAAGTGTMNQTGGTFTDSSQLLLSELGTAAYNISGGTANANGGTFMAVNNGNATLTLQGNTGNTGTLPNGGGNAVFNTTLLTMGGANGTTGTSTINLDGSTLSVQRIAGGATLASKVVNFNGGTLRLLANDAPLAPSISAVTTNVKTGGAIVDSGGFNGTIFTNLIHSGASPDGGVTKNGRGALTLTGTSTYDGATTVNGGALIAESPAALPNWNVLNAIKVLPGAALGGRIGGAGFSIADFNTLIGSGNYQNGSSVAIDTTNGDLSYDATNLHTATSAGASVGLYKAGGGILTVTGPISFTGPVGISGGSLVFSGGSLPSNTTIAVDGGILDLNGANLTETSLAVGSGQLISTGGSTLTLTSTGNAIDFNGTGTFTPPSIAATVNINLTGATGGAIVKTSNTGVPAFNGNLDLGGKVRTIALEDTGGDGFPEFTIGGVVSNGGITLDNAFGNVSTQDWGSLGLLGANTYTGVTTITKGRVIITTATSLGTTAGNTVIGSEGTLSLGGAGRDIDTGISVAENLVINHTISGSYGLIAMQNNSGVNTLTGTVSIGADFEVQSNSGSLSFATPITETAPSAFIKSGGADVIFPAANAYTGATIINSGGIIANNVNALGSSAVGTEVRDTGRLVLGSGLTFGAEPLVINGAGGNLGGALQAAAGGVSTWTSDITLGSIGTGEARIGAQAGGTLTVNGVIKDGSSTGVSFSGISGTGTVILKGNNTYTGPTTNIRGNLILDGAVISSGAAVNFAGNASAENATVTIQNGALVNGDTITLGTAGGASVNMAVWTQTDGIVNSKQWTIFGSTGAGTAVGTITGGELNVKIADSGPDRSLEVGTFDTVKGTFNVGGTATVRLEFNANIAIGAQGNSADNTFNQNGGTVTFYGDGGTSIGGAGELRIGQAGTGNNVYNLNGGTLTVPKITRTSTSGTGTLNFNGGILKPATDENQLVVGVDARIRNGGAIVDTNGMSVSIASVLSHSTTDGDSSIDGGLTKQGAGLLTLEQAPTYTGNTKVTGGTLQVLAESDFSDTSEIQLSNGAILDLQELGADTVNKLVIDGAPVATGSWGPVGSGAQRTTPRLTGFGILIVKNLVISTPFQTFASDNGLAGANALAGADPDHDGYNNLAEFILGGQPNPANAGAGSTPAAPTVEASGGNHIFSFRRSEASNDQPGLTIIYQYGNDLVGWKTAPSVADGVTVTSTPEGYGAGINRVDVVVPDSLAPVGKRFVRMNAKQN